MFRPMWEAFFELVAVQRTRRGSDLLTGYCGGTRAVSLKQKGISRPIEAH